MSWGSLSCNYFVCFGIELNASLDKEKVVFKTQYINKNKSIHKFNISCNILQLSQFSNNEHSMFTDTMWFYSNMR